MKEHLMPEETLRAGASLSNITPALGSALSGSFHPRYAEDVEDDLHARALVLDNGEKRLALVVCDLICLPRKAVDAAKARITERCGIPSEAVMISCTHTHSGPATCGLLGTDEVPGYLDFAVPRIADAVERACRRLAPARVAWGAGCEPGLVFNRRYRMKDGSVRMNPGYLHPDLVEPVGPTDPEVGALFVETPEGRPIAVLANYALHYVGGAPGTSISADYFARFGQALQRMRGESFVVLLGNGCCGDVNNCNYRGPAPTPAYRWERADRAANLLAAEVMKVWQRCSFRQEVALDCRLEEVTAAVRQPDAETLAKARAMPPKPVSEMDRDELYLREALIMTQGPPEVRTPVQALRVGDLGIAALSGEIFCQFGLDIKAASRFETTMVIELANDYTGYIPTLAAFEEGGYETWLARSSKLEPAAGPRMAETAIRLLAELRPA